MSKVNKAKDAFFYQKINNGDYIVSKNGNIRNRSGKILGTVNSKGYVTLGALCNGKLLIIQAHRVVWMALKGPIPDGKEPNHKNGKKIDNAIDNLELKTCGGNIRHAYRTGLNLGTWGEDKGSAKLTELQVIKARKLIRNNITTVVKLAHRFNVSRTTMRMAIIGKTWKHLDLNEAPVMSIPRGKSYVERYTQKYNR